MTATNINWGSLEGRIGNLAADLPLPIRLRLR
jgi:hypothetical protein